MTLQEIILDSLLIEKQKFLIDNQLEEANDILKRDGKFIKSFVITSIGIDEVRPSQIGEDYENPSSKEDAVIYSLAKKGNIGIDDLRLESFRPILVDRKTNEIIDGNHRHYAAKAVCEKFIFVLLCEIGKINY
jgi:hypothetical protein